MATPILYNLSESKGTGQSFADIMGFFVPAYLVISVIFVVFKFNFEPTLTILAGFILGMMLKAIDFPSFYENAFNNYDWYYRFIGGEGKEGENKKEIRKFYLNLFKDPKYSVEIYRNLGYSNCFIHMSIPLLIIGIIYILTYFRYIDIAITYGFKTGLMLIIIGILTFYASVGYRKKMYKIIGEELGNFTELLSVKKEDLYLFDVTNIYSNEAKIKNEIEKEEIIVKLLESNPTLISKEGVNELLTIKKQNLFELMKSRLNLQLELYKKVKENIDEIQNRISDIKFPAQLNALDDKNSEIKKYIIEIKNSLITIQEQIKENKFSSEDIPFIFDELNKFYPFIYSLNEYIDFESYLNYIHTRILKIKETSDISKKEKLLEIEEEANNISSWYQNNKTEYDKRFEKQEYYMPKVERFPLSSEIEKKQKILEKIEKKLNNEFTV